MASRSPETIATLRAAVAIVDAGHRANTDVELVIAELSSLHGARRTLSPTGNTLVCGSVRATCTWSKGEGLLRAWRRLAGVRLQIETGKIEARK